jgi:hypothetical protein
MSYTKFISTNGPKLVGKRVVPTGTSIEDLSMFHLYLGESIGLFESKGRTYVKLSNEMGIGDQLMNDRLNHITAYLKALAMRKKRV